MTAYYNEHDPKAAAWLRELIKRGLIAPGDVDERSIEDIRPDELTKYIQLHFFAGIGVWSYALRKAGWPDDRPVWTGSCPCQPFSSAGKGAGFADERHLWPAWHWLIQQCEPSVVFGEQVASKDGLAWLDIVQTDLENTGYACGAVDLCAAGVGAPHIRQRLFFAAERLADASSTASRWDAGTVPRAQAESGEKRVEPWHQPDGLEPDGSGQRVADSVSAGRPEGLAGAGKGSVTGGCEPVGMANAHFTPRERHRKHGRQCLCEQEAVRPSRTGLVGELAENRSYSGVFSKHEAGGLADASSTASRWDAGTVPRAQAESGEKRVEHGHQPDGLEPGGSGKRVADSEHAQRRAKHRSCDRVAREYAVSQWEEGSDRHAGDCQDGNPGPTNGLWRDVDWLGCRDGKFRPVEPGTFPLVDGAAARVGRLRGYGNAINAEVARIFIESYLDRPVA